MQTGFSFKGIHSSQMGISAATKVRPLIPQVRRCDFTLPLADGKYDFSAANVYGRPFYEDRVFTVIIHISEKDIYALQKRLSKIAVWLMGSGELIFDDMPSVIWKARVNGGMDYVPEKRGRSAIISVSFDVAAFSEGQISTKSGIYLESVVRLDSKLPLNLVLAMCFNFGNGKSEIEVMNIGTAPVRPVFDISCAADIDDITLSVGNVSLEVKELKSDVVIDCAKCELNGSGDMHLVTLRGDFPELAPGKNVIKIETSARGECNMRVLYTPKFIYDSEYEDIDWGVENA